MKNMQLLVFVLSKYEKLDRFLTALDHAGIKGATVLNSTGMARLLSSESEAILGSLRSYFTPEREDNRTIFIVACEEKINRVKEIIHEVFGSLDQPDTGILFVIPTIYTEGIIDCS
jgi:nitrogen regulatory protein PII